MRFLHGVKIETNYNSVSYDAESDRYVHHVGEVKKRNAIKYQWTPDIAALTLELSGHDSENL